MNLRKNILSALLIAIGFILHQMVPGVIGSMKFDIMLSVIFVSLFINKELKNTVVTALLGGIITAMTTTFPGGQIPNVIDKLITCAVVFVLIKFTEKLQHKAVVRAAISFIGTMISGTVFLLSAFYLVGLPAPFQLLFLGIVLPTSITNVFLTAFIYQAVQMALKVTGVKFIQE